MTISLGEQLRQSNDARERYKDAIKAVPVVLSQLDNDGKDFLAEIMQAAVDAGYHDGFYDGHRSLNDSVNRPNQTISNVTFSKIPGQNIGFVHAEVDGHDAWLRDDGTWTYEEDDPAGTIPFGLQSPEDITEVKVCKLAHQDYGFVHAAINGRDAWLCQDGTWTYTDGDPAAQLHVRTWQTDTCWSCGIGRGGVHTKDCIFSGRVTKGHQIEYRCPVCKGNRYVDGGVDGQECPECGGTGNTIDS